MYRSTLAIVLTGMSALAAGDPAAPPAAQTQAATQPDASRVCPQDSGTRIKQQPGSCLSSPGRTYGSDEIRNTGATNAADALSKMDPSLTVRH